MKMLHIYRASAGSGKTFQLTKDYIFLLFSAIATNPHPHRRILGVTFTNKATEEMKSRILQELHLLSLGKKSNYRDDLQKEFSLTANEVNERAKKILTAILHDYSSFSISTIDKFFQQIVRSFAREIGVNGGYNIELDVDLTLQQAIDNMYSDLSKKEDKQLMEWLIEFMQEKIEDGKSWKIEKNIASIGKELFKENFQHKASEVQEKLNDKDFLKEYRGKLRDKISNFDNEVEAEVTKALNAISEQGITGKDFYGKKLETNLLKIGEKKNYDLSNNTTIEKFASNVENCYSDSTKQHIKNSIEAAYNNGLGQSLKRIVYLLSKEVYPYNSAKIILENLNMLGILSDLAHQIDKLTTEQNTMLLADTNMLLNKIIDNSDTPFVYERTGLSIDHYMIDEFQDTSVLQWENFKPLVSNSVAFEKRNMVVGDIKQSIYRWRNSDWKLLAKQVEQDFSGQTTPKGLDTNWRSDKNIIQFNNAFFEKASTLLQEKLNSNIEENNQKNNLKSVITNAYRDVKQKVSKNASEGFVRIEFIKNARLKADRMQMVLEKIPTLLEDLVDRGYKPNDIAFIVRKNDEATELINYLLNFKNSPKAHPGFNYDVVGSEGIKLTSSASINFIIAVLKLVFNPKDDVSRTIMQYEYQVGKMGKTADEAVRSCCYDVGMPSARSPLFTNKENKCIDEISRMSLFEATEKLINTFGIENWHNETVFLQTFQDEVFKFANTANADLNSFLRWWDENSNKLNIDAPENESAFRVTTIHKAKGLDFKVVIIPFCNWDLDSNKRPLLWCDTSNADSPFNELPLTPVQYSSKLANTIFRKNYFEEQMHQYVDNLNLAYVAFTRARNEMLIFADYPSEKVKNMSDLLFKSLSGNSVLSEFWNEEKTIFKIGEPTTAVYKDKKSESTSQKRTSYPIADSSERLKIRHTSQDYWKEAPISESRVNYGTIMHEILQKTIRLNDEEKAIAEQIAEGKITESDLPMIRKELEQFWSIPEVKEWFTTDAEVLNENAILLPSGEMYRPDRVLLKGDKATVVDYKFGEEEHEYHKGQLKQYISFLKEMGYAEVKGVLYYASLGKIIKDVIF